MLGTLLLVREPYLELNPDVAWIARWKFGGCLDPFFLLVILARSLALKPGLVWTLLFPTWKQCFSHL